MRPLALLALLLLPTLGCRGSEPEEEPPPPAPEPEPIALPEPTAVEEPPAPEPTSVIEPADDTGFEPILFGDTGVLAYDTTFFPGANYDPAVPTPDEILGTQHASRLSHHEEILSCFERWAMVSPRVRLRSHGKTHEGRALIHAVVTSPANHARLGEILDDVGRLHDPRGLTDDEAQRIVAESPAVAWMGYSIHGDETSGADASVAVGYHLIAGTDPDVARLLEELVIVIDPVMNPDGRERILSMVEQSAGYTPSLDWASMHRGRWPYGRGNHYLFDMNRDWMAGTQPETRGRWKAALEFHPQLFVDAHEMGSLDTFLFYPQEEPINPHVPFRHREWHARFALGTASAFDAHGWGYYTREWADGWGPFYSDAWGSLSGATGILYEQARTVGSALMRESGRILTYREAVHHQTVASLANLTTLANNRQDALLDYLENKRRSVAPDGEGNDRMFVLAPGPHPERESALLGALLDQGIEVFRSTQDFGANAAVDRFNVEHGSHTFPAGSWIVPAAQPMRAMVLSYLQFDPRMDKEALLAEREDLERKGSSRIYDSTAWSLVHALDIDGWWVGAADVEREALDELPEAEGGIVGAPTARIPFGWVVDGDTDASVAFAARAMEAGLQVHLSDKPFTVGERPFPRGSLLVRRDENEGTHDQIATRIEQAAQESGATVHVAVTGRSPDEGPDLGGGHFDLLSRPRIALVSNAPIAPDTYGHLWYQLDHVLGVPIATLDAQLLGTYDLRRYNVLILPPTWRGLDQLLEPLVDDLQAWVRGGGTLIACADAAASLTQGRLGLSAVTLRRHALDELEPYRTQAEREASSREVTIDEALVWGDPVEASAPEAGGDENGVPVVSEEPDDEEEPEEVDEQQESWLRRFSPRGVTLRGLVDDTAWITAGAGEELPVFFSGSGVFLSKEPVATPVRLAGADRLRLSGLVWPEARERLEHSAWLTVERSGNGQIVLFAAVPGYRGFHAGTARLFANAAVYGPGAGARQPMGW